MCSSSRLLRSTSPHSCWRRSRRRWPCGSSRGRKSSRGSPCSLRSEVLLLLDNFEQVIDAAPTLGRLLSEAPGLRLLVTSRESLRIAGEQEYPVEPLSAPDPSVRLDPARLSEFPAVALFLERALTARFDFAVTNENAPAVAEICARLDGLPLAIELAAARIRLLSPQALLVRLDERLKLLTGGARGAPERQQTLRAAIDWSYRLLSEPEQRLFARLSVFVGGGRFEEAEAVADHDGMLGVELLDGLQSLVEKSLLRRRDDPDGEPRFWMLGTIREYATDALGADSAAARRAHALAYLALAERYGGELDGPGEAPARRMVHLEQPNLRAALDWTIEAADAVSLVNLWIAAGPFWLARDDMREARAYVEPALAAGSSDALTHEVRARVLRIAYWTYAGLGEHDRAAPIAEERMRIARESGDPWHLAGALSSLASAAAARGDFRQAVELQSECVAIARTMGDAGMLAIGLLNLAVQYEDLDDWASCQRTNEEALTMFRELGMESAAAQVGQNLAQALLMRGDTDSALEHFRTSLPILQENGDLSLVAWALQGFGLIALERGDFERAAKLCAARRTIHQQIGYVPPPHTYEIAERQLQPIAARRGEPSVDKAWAEGEAMPLDEIVAYALEEENPPGRVGC